MKPNPAPYVPGQTEAECMDNAVRKMFSVSKEDMLKAEQQLKHDHQRKKETGEEEGSLISPRRAHHN